MTKAGRSGAASGLVLLVLPTNPGASAAHSRALSPFAASATQSPGPPWREAATYAPRPGWFRGRNRSARPLSTAPSATAGGREHARGRRAGRTRAAAGESVDRRARRAGQIGRAHV